MKHILIYLPFLISFSLQAQSRLTLEECYDRAMHNYPLVQQRDLLSRAKKLSVDNASRAALPRISVGGQATYQSHVTRIPVEMPGVEPLSRHQSRVFGEVSQTLYHGGLVREGTMAERMKHDVEERELEVELYQVYDRINDIFFGILLSQDLMAQIQLSKADVTAALKRVQASIAQGTALRTAADVLNAELLRMDQRIAEIHSNGDSYRNMLSLFINEPVTNGTILERPVFDEISSEVRRPEIQLFEAEQRNLDQSERLLSAEKPPRVDLFIQGGYGRPGLNMLENRFGSYYLGGIRLSWNLFGYYTYRGEKEIIKLRKQSLDARRQTFLFNTELMTGQQEVEIARFQKLLEADDKIIALRQKVKETASIQLEEGVITPTDFIQEVNAEDQAKQTRAFHETQLLIAHARLRFTKGQYKLHDNEND